MASLAVPVGNCEICHIISSSTIEVSSSWRVVRPAHGRSKEASSAYLSSWRYQKKSRRGVIADNDVLDGVPSAFNK